MPRRRPVPALVDQCAARLRGLVRDEALRVAAFSVNNFVFDELEAQENEERAETTAWEREIYLSDQVEFFKQHIVSYLASNVMEKILGQVLEGIKDAILAKKQQWTHTTSMTKFAREMYAVVKFANILVLPTRKYLDLSTTPKMIRTKLYGCLQGFKGLTVLKLGSGSGGWVTEAFADNFLIGIPHMPCLVHFSLKYDCTVNVLQVLSETCSRTLKVLDVERSRQIRDDAVPYILSCTELVDINIFQTDLSVAKFAEILLGLRKLRHLQRGDFLADAVEHLHSRGKLAQLKLEEFWSSEEYFFHTEEQLRLVSNYCPEVRKMLVMFQVAICKLSVLLSFRHLESLELWGGAFYTDGLSELLEAIGHQLKRLCLVHVEEIDERAWAIVTVCCTSLESLGFHNCEFAPLRSEAHLDLAFREADRLHESQEAREVRELTMPLLSVKTFKIISFCPFEYLVLILSQCVNVREIFIGMNTGISDDCLGLVLARNDLEHLETLVVQKCAGLTMRGLNMVLDNCPNLKVLKHLTYFEGVHEMEVKMLRAQVRDSNWDLDTGEDDERKALMAEMDMMRPPAASTTDTSNLPQTYEGAPWQEGWS